MSAVHAICPIIGIGGSAGGLDALQRFVGSLQPGRGLAFIVVQHLDPDHNSTLTELLARKSQVPVTLVKTDMPVEPDHIYVIPPNADLTINNGRLYLAKPAEPRGHRYPIDRFFVSLAQDQADKAACVILSGTGSDGTLGLRAIKENGGLTLAQAEAEYDGMMRSALGTGLVDFVLPAAEMPAKLADYFRYLTDVSQKNGSEFVRQQGTDYLTEVCALLRARTGHDFKDYKDKTIVRRIQRRMQVLQIDNLPDLIARLRKDPREIDLLFQDLLIGVTDFFRDPKAFETLEKQVIPHLFEGKGPEDRIRVWVPGCSTGEEAYSIAMLLREGAPKPHEMPKLQIFASDIDEHALATARVGRYPASIAKDVALERLELFFMREDGTYRIVSDLRETCLFSPHDLLRDAPFSKLDLISCRNLLIYLNPGLQDRVIPLFNYALRDEGYLFLGTSENVSRHSRLFTTIDKTHRLFRRRPQTDRRLPEFPLTTPDGARLKPAQAARPGTADMGLRGLAERQILDRYAPAYVIINAEGEVLQSSARTGRYLELPAGAPDHNIYNMARRGLRLELRNAVHNAVRSGQVATQGNISVDTDAGSQTIDLIVQPLATGTSPDGLYMIVFRDVGEIKPVADQEPAEPVENANLRHLEMELRGTRERLQTTTEELESSNEELKSGNEELSSINEELQSANEELETAKEELQSINEELQTVNTELNARVEELSRANSDMANLLESTQIATVFLDRSFTVKSFTPAAKDVFRLVESDTGRPITHVRARFGLDTVQEDAERVLRTLGAIEKQVHGDNGSHYIMRILPYRTVDNVINGVVITFTDVTRIAAAEARIDELTHDLRNRVDSLETLLDLVPVGILIAEDDHGQPIRINQHGARLLGESDNQHGLRQMTRSLRLLEHGRELPPDQQPLARAGRTGETVPGFEGRVLRNDGSTADVMISATPLLDDSGEARGAIAAIVDISQRKRAEAHQETLLHELQHRVKNVLATVSSLASRMLKSSGSKEEFSAAFLGRLSAMGDMHELLSRRKWEGADLGAVAKAALAPHANIDKANIQLGGPDLLLAPGVATTLGMALHELATNAAKFGALSSPKGRVDVVWDVVGPPEGRRLSLTWAERNGPAVTTPGNDGFGTYFVKRSIEYELDGTAQIVFEPDGLRCVVDIPLSLNGTRGDP